jgi:putative DNA primase/helicase
MADTDNIIRLAELEDTGELPPTAEEALALAFADRHADTLRHVAKWGSWLSFDGTRWQHDETLHAFDLARAICREAALESDKSPSTVASAKTVAAVERLAKADRRLAATVEQFDSNPWLLNAAGETYDLRTGIGRDPDPNDYLTKQAGCACAPVGTPHPKWTAFLKRITNGDTELQAFHQRYAGYCCTGLTTEHVFLFGYGTGANGKGTYMNTIAKVFGDYATVADMNTFLHTRNERHPADLAKLYGARLVIAQETERGRRWDEAKIKTLTGGDRITARYMRQDYFDFDPTFKLFIAGNHKPRLNTIDEAMRRRLLLAPFKVLIKPAERDKDFADKLKAEYPAILRWCIDGCLQWQRDGLKPPASVRDATASYFADQDVVQQWLDECTTDDFNGFTRLSELFASWKHWCDTRNLPIGTATALADMLDIKGYERKREGHTGQRGHCSLVLRTY